ncbi:hypothetical protein HRbin36_01915 [bacterium HR36]|nr:hypothetical protein HRbin36_01915 [bacterium HR36]
MAPYFRKTRSFLHNPFTRHALYWLCGCCFALSGFLYGQPDAVSNPDAKSLLQQTLRHLPQADFWMFTFREQWSEVGLLAEAEGSLAVGPSRRCRLEIRIRLADVQADWRLYSDGQTVWRQERLPQTEPKLIRYTFDDLHQAIAQANLSESDALRLREAVLAEHGYQSLRWRLMELSSRYQWGPAQTTKLADGRPAWLLEGTYNEKTLQDAFRGQLPQAPEIPKRSRVYLLRLQSWWGGEFLWPARIEWWGLPRNQKEDRLLAWLEYDTPQRLAPDAPQLQPPFTDQEMANSEPADPSSLIADTLQRLR